MSHTPGPWSIGTPYLDDDGYREIPIHAPVRGVQATPAVICLQFPTLGQMQEANARLIAAAPDLLKACKRVIAAQGPGGIAIEGTDAQFALESMKAVIDKVEDSK